MKMFKQHFGMRLNPFDKDTEVDKLYPSKDIQELESRLKYMMENRGIFLLVGEPGSGKSTALRKFAESLGPSLFKPCYLPLTTLTVNDFYGALCMMLGEAPRYRKIDMFAQIQRAVGTLYHEQKITPVIIIDEIHMASTAVLDDIRMLFNFKMDSENPYILILTGQPVIRNKLAMNACYPLKQRISVKYSMSGLDEDETKDYLTTRMELAGAGEGVFTTQATVQMYKISGGCPRIINNLAIHSLMYAAAKNLGTVDEEAVYQANVELSI
jgi:type II secretory pathway predicted ATPase ExeA